LPSVYDELRKLAAAKLAQEKPGQTLQATALVHEAYIRLVDVEKSQHWNSRGHFFTAAAEAMRAHPDRIARRKQRERHGGDWNRVELKDMAASCHLAPDRLLALSDAIDKLAEHDGTWPSSSSCDALAVCPWSRPPRTLGMSRTNAYLVNVLRVGVALQPHRRRSGIIVNPHELPRFLGRAGVLRRTDS